MKTLVLTLSLFLISTSYGAIKSSLKSKHQKQKKEIQRLEKSLNHLESSLGAKNDRYLRLEKRKRWMEEEGIRLEKLSFDIKERLKDNQHESQKIYRELVLSSFESYEATELLETKVLQENLIVKLKVLKEDLSKADHIQKRVVMLRERIFEYSNIQGEIVSILNNLESQKALVSRKVTDANKKERSLFSRLKKELLKKASGARFMLPLQSISALRAKGTSLHFKAKKNQKVKASGDGKIAYVGTLSAYGNVLIIDHGKDLHSVIVGDFESKVKKGQEVQKGDFIALTKNDLGGRVEFDMRKKSQTQKLSKYFKKKLLKKRI